MRVEVPRAVAHGSPEQLAAAHRVIRGLALVRLDRVVLDRAAEIRPPALRTLDAVHLATAQSLGEGLAVLIAYDRRLLDAARDAGLPVASPQ